MSDFHSAAYWHAGRAVLAVRKFLPLSALDITKPDATLDVARRAIADRLAAYHRAPRESRRTHEPDLTALAVGAAAQRQGAAKNPEWESATIPLSQSLPLRSLVSEARRFVSDQWPSITRLAKTLLAERKLSVGVMCWILDASPQRLAA